LALIIEQINTMSLLGHLENKNQKYLVAGLGNPGRQYQGTRHNIGFMVVDCLAEKHGIRLSRVQQKAIVGEGHMVDRPVILVKPQTFMNRSGDSIGPLVNYYKVSLENVLVIYDEIDLAFGTLRLRSMGGSGGHNGMRSVIQHLGQDFPRLRLGVGRPSGKMPPAAHVLRDFDKDELPVLAELIDSAVGAVETYLLEGVNLAMTRHNGVISQE
jgi:PTH1 family peptidyl-tRNA hydrolase